MQLEGSPRVVKVLRLLVFIVGLGTGDPISIGLGAIEMFFTCSVGLW